MFLKEQNKFKFDMNSARFGIDINTYDGIEKIKVGGIRKINIDTCKLKIHLSSKYKISFSEVSLFT